MDSVRLTTEGRAFIAEMLKKFDVAVERAAMADSNSFAELLDNLVHLLEEEHLRERIHCADAAHLWIMLCPPSSSAVTFADLAFHEAGLVRL